MNFRRSSLHVVERRAVLAARPDVRQTFGELADGALDTSRVAAGHDERAFSPKAFLTI